MDVIIGTALMLIIFVALNGLLRTSLLIASLAKTKSIATTAAGSQMEYIRSLTYDSVGTLGGIPAGVVPQNATTTINGLAVGIRTFIEYADDPADGTGAADTNGITTDYKRIKVTASYEAAGQFRTIDVVSNYAPPGLETTTNGGTLQVQVVSAVGAPVSGASVRILNSSINPTVDVTTFSDARLKTNITDLSPTLSKIKALRPVNYNWINPAYGGGRQTGFLAQDVRKIFPEFVGEDKNGRLSVNYAAMVSPIVKSIQEQQQQIEDLKKQNQQLQQKMQQLVDMIKKLASGKK